MQRSQYKNLLDMNEFFRIHHTDCRMKFFTSDAIPGPADEQTDDDRANA